MTFADARSTCSLFQESNRFVVVRWDNSTNAHTDPASPLLDHVWYSGPSTMHQLQVSTSLPPSIKSSHPIADLQALPLAFLFLIAPLQRLIIPQRCPSTPHRRPFARPRVIPIHPTFPQVRQRHRRTIPRPRTPAPARPPHSLHSPGPKPAPSTSPPAPPRSTAARAPDSASPSHRPADARWRPGRRHRPPSHPQRRPSARRPAGRCSWRASAAACRARCRRPGRRRRGSRAIGA